MAALEIVLLRHGIAVDRAESRSSDAARPLTGEGRRKVGEAAEGLAAAWQRPDVIVHSGLVRARETAELVAKRLKPRAKELARTEALEPAADPSELMEYLAALDAKRALLVGHAPQLDRFLAFACGGGGGAATMTELGKSGGACLELDPSRRGPARLVWLLTPKLLRRLA